MSLTGWIVFSSLFFQGAKMAPNPKSGVSTAFSLINVYLVCYLKLFFALSFLLLGALVKKSSKIKS
jgi:hypothetical protein